jgi:type II secretion system protein L
MSDLILLCPVASLDAGAFASDSPVWRLTGSQPQRSTLAAALTGARRPVVLLHPADARLARLKLPALGRDKLQRAAVLALDDQVLTDPASMAVALGRRHDDLQEVVLADRGLLAGLRTALTQCGVGQTPVGAAAGALPAGALPCAMVDGDDAVLFHAQGAVCIPLAQLPFVAQMAGIAGGVLYGTQSAPEGWTAHAGMPPFEVPQILFVDAKAQSAALKRWRVPLILAGLCLVGWMIGLLAWRSVVQGESDRLRGEILAQFKKVLPNAPLLDPVAQLRQAATQGGAASSFERLMDAADKAAAALPPQAVASSDFNADRLVLRFAKDKFNAGARGQFETAARAAGLTLSWTSELAVTLSLGGKS